MTSQFPAMPEVREELERIRSSSGFRDRENLQHLLAYLVEHTLDGSAKNLKEYVIGLEVFGKPDGYDPQSDASVRVQIGRLRRKLDEYYQSEGMSDELLMQLPKRQFAVLFERRPALPPPAGEHSLSNQRRRVIPAAGLQWGLTIFFAGLALFLALRPTSRPQPVSAALDEIWRPFLAESRPVLIALGTVPFYAYSAGFVREPWMDTLTAAERQPRLDELRTILHSTEPLKPYLSYTGVGQATAAFLLSKQFAQMNLPVDLVRSNALSWDEIEQHNVIFLGSAKLNSQLRDIPVTWAFRVEGGRIVNLRPKAGEAASYGPDYSLISLFPGLHGKGEILVVESASTTGVWAAAQFLTDPGYARELVAHLRDAAGRFPAHYQVVLKSQIAADVPIRIGYVTHRILQGLN
ncbi:MAG TPA: hypothetical protein VG675_17550 [Bryobacteraceae bacterium]|nr:hypothetical protein [Bryobacteraceae bacterium]